MIKNIWSKMKIYCMNHEEPLEMQIVTNTEYIKTPFYACKNYIVEPGSGDVPCKNRLNLDNYQEIILELLEKIDEDDIVGDYTNLSFSYKKHKQNIYVKVLQWSDKEIKIGILNKGVLGIK